MGRAVKLFVMVVGLVMSAATPALAAILDFGFIAPTAGSISYTGGGASLLGTDIEVDNVTGLDGTPLNNLTSFDIIGGDLDFASGGFTGFTDLGGGFGVWFFGSGGAITLAGGVDVNGDGDLDDLGDIPSTTLFSGSFTAPVTVLGGGFAGTFKILGPATFEDIKDEDLAALYGLQASGFGFGWVGNLNLSFSASGSGGAAFTSTTILSGDLVNEAVIPEPTSMLLLGLGLLGGVASRRKLFNFNL
jgi:hypothetical protein